MNKNLSTRSVCNTGLIFISFDLCILEKLELGKGKNIIVHFNYHYYFTSLPASKLQYYILYIKPNFLISSYQMTA